MSIGRWRVRVNSQKMSQMITCQSIIREHWRFSPKDLLQIQRIYSCQLKDPRWLNKIPLNSLVKSTISPSKSYSTSESLSSPWNFQEWKNWPILRSQSPTKVKRSEQFSSYLTAPASNSYNLPASSIAVWKLWNRPRNLALKNWRRIGRLRGKRIEKGR